MIKRAETKDCEALADLAIKMWTESDHGELAEEFRVAIDSGDAACFLKFVDGEAVGFARCQLRRDYVEGTKTSPVGYLEGVFVEECHRKKGYARELLKACEKWAKSKGCVEFASDCELNNADSLKFHLSAGFEEANRIICFKKKI